MVKVVKVVKVVNVVNVGGYMPISGFDFLGSLAGGILVSLL